MALDEPSCLKKLKTMREQVDWKIRKERHKFFLQLYPLVKDWNGQLPNLKDIFRPKEIDWLLTDSINHRGKGKGYGREIFVKFVARTGYKDEPEVGEGSELPLRHTTALHCAARLGPEKFSKESVNKLFLIYDRFEVNYTDNRGITHFHAACEYGCYEVVEKFLELGLDPNCRTKKWGLTPIILALSWGHGRVAELLLRNGAHLHTTDRFGCTPLHLICQKKYDYDLVELFFKIFDEQHQLVEVNARDKLDRTPLHYAAERHFKKVIELLLKRGADMNLVDTYGSTPLHKICAKTSDFGYDDTADIDGGLVELFFKISDEKHQPVEVNARDTGDRTPLHYAVKRGCRFKRTTELLLRRGADANSADENGSTPLHLISNLSCKCNEEDYRDNNYCLLELFFNICDEQHQLVEINARDKYGATPLHYAVDHKLKKTTELLLRRGANPNLAIDFTQCTVYWIGLTPLHMICQRDVSAIFLKFFFDVNDEIHQTVEVDALDKDGNTPLHFTLLSRFFRLAEVLLRGGANPNLVNENGSPPLHLICGIHKDDEGAAFLKIFFEICAEKNHKVQVDARNEEGQTPLQLALDYRNKKVAELLLKNGADPNLADEDRSTLLHYICERKHEDSVMKFLKIYFEINDDQNRQVLVDARDKSGKTPLQLAVTSFLPKAIDILLDHGADLSKLVFPTESDFDQSFRDRASVHPVNFKALCGAMVVVERLEKRGYKLIRHDALIIMNLFAKYGFFDRSESLEFWLSNEKFVEDAKNKILRSGDNFQNDKEAATKAKGSLGHSSLSLYDVVLVPLEEAKKLFTYDDYTDFARNNCCWHYIDEKPCQACLVHLSEIMSRGFFQSWALEPFLELTHNRLPILCCELIIKNLMNEDLYNICLAAEIAA